MGKRGSKEAPLHVKKIREMFVANLGRLSNLFYGIESPQRRDDQDRAKVNARDEVGCLHDQDFNSHYSSSQIIRRKIPFFEKWYDASWKKHKEIERRIPQLMVDLELVKKRSDLKPIVTKPIKSSNNAVTKVRNAPAAHLPTPEDAFNILLKLDTRPDSIWPELQKDAPIISIFQKLIDVLVRHKSVTFTSMEAFYMDMVSEGDPVAPKGWRYDAEAFLQSLLKCITPVLRQHYYDFTTAARVGGGNFTMEYDQNISLQINLPDEIKEVTWAEIRSNLKMK